MKALRGTPKHLKLSRELIGFTYLMLALPFRCNYRCQKCFNLEGGTPSKPIHPLRYSDFIRAVKDASNGGARAVVLAGEGEPALDPHFSDIVAATYEAGVIPIIYTNASTLTPQLAKFLFSKNASLVIALDSLDSIKYRELAGIKQDLLPVVLKNIDHTRALFSSAIEKAGDLSIVRLAINMTITSRNKGEIDAIRKFAGKDMYFVCNPLARYGNAVMHWPLLVDDDSDFYIQQRLVRTYSESGGPLTLNQAGTCGYSANGIGIGPEGHYMTCAYTTRTNGLLGNFREKSLAEAYAAKRQVEAKHYERFGVSACLVRDEHFPEFVATLKR